MNEEKLKQQIDDLVHLIKIFYLIKDLGEKKKIRREIKFLIRELTKI